MKLMTYEKAKQICEDIVDDYYSLSNEEREKIIIVYSPEKGKFRLENNLPIFEEDCERNKYSREEYTEYLLEYLVNSGYSAGE